MLAEVAGEVYAVERLAPLAERARAALARLGYANVHVAIGDGARGWHEQAPFQGILVAAAADEVPPELLGQLADGGRLVVPVGRSRGEQVLTIVERAGDSFEERHDTRCRFVPLVRDVSPDERRKAARGGSGADADAGWPLGGEDARGDSTYPAEEADMKSVEVRVSGMVQGVYFRASARREGALRGLRGWVRNESDGTVRLRLQGEEHAVDSMLDWCRVGPPAARVSRLTVADVPADETLQTFEVGRCRRATRRDAGRLVTLEDVRRDHEVQVFVRKADENLGVLGYTEHGPRHCSLVADVAQDVLLQLGYPARTAELAAIAGYLHDIGNGINRLDHGIGAALLSRHILERLGMGPDEYAEVMVAIGNHEEEYGQAVSPLAAAVILGDKSDVHRSRVRVLDLETDDIHDRVNMATTRSS